MESKSRKRNRRFDQNSIEESIYIDPSEKEPKYSLIPIRKVEAKIKESKGNRFKESKDVGESKKSRPGLRLRLSLSLFAGDSNDLLQNPTSDSETFQASKVEFRLDRLTCECEAKYIISSRSYSLSTNADPDLRMKTCPVSARVESPAGIPTVETASTKTINHYPNFQDLVNILKNRLGLKIQVYRERLRPKFFQQPQRHHVQRRGDGVFSPRQWGDGSRRPQRSLPLPRRLMWWLKRKNLNQLEECLYLLQKTVGI